MAPNKENSQSTSLVHSTNKLLNLSGFVLTKEFSTVEEICRVSSSLFVAIFESLFNMEIGEINRQPRGFRDHAYNADLIVNGLSEYIEMDLSHITGEEIVDGSIGAISNLVHILLRIVTITNEEYDLCLAIIAASADAEEEDEYNRLARKGDRTKQRQSRATRKRCRRRSYSC